MRTNRHGKSGQIEADDERVTSAAIQAEVREVAGHKIPRVLERVDFSFQIRHFVKLAKRGPHGDASPAEIAASHIAKCLQANLYPHTEHRDSQIAQCLRKYLGSLDPAGAIGVIQLMREAELHPQLWESAFD